MLSTEYKLPSDGGLCSRGEDGMRPSASTHTVPAWDTPTHHQAKPPGRECQGPVPVLSLTAKIRVLE